MQPFFGIGGRISDKQGGYSIVYSLTRPDFVLIRMCVMYGIDVVDGNDRHLEVAERGASVFDTAIVPGRYLVETIPVLSKLPAWFPFAQFKRDAAALAKYVYAARNDPYEEVIQSLAQGTAQPSILSTLIEQAIQEHGKVPPEDEEHFKDVSAVAYIAGVDSSVTTILVFFLAMIMHPRVQARAQEELDNIIGPERLPTFGDRDAVPYINALIKECIRWRSIIPLSVFHRAVDDVEYDGHLLPKGSTLIANAWAMSRDPVAYPDPESFIPERFLKNGKLDPDVRDPSKFLFGFGRRICPGQYFAGDVLFIIIASILHAFKIEPQLDERGQPIPVTADLPLDSGVSHPGPFECKITPRSSAVAALIRQSFAND